MKNREFYKNDLEAAVNQYKNDFALIQFYNSKIHDITNATDYTPEHSFYEWLNDQYRDPSKQYSGVKLDENDNYIWIENFIIINKTIYQTNINKAIQVLKDNGIEDDECETVLQAIGYTLLDVELFEDK